MKASAKAMSSEEISKKTYIRGLKNIPVPVGKITLSFPEHF